MTQSLRNTALVGAVALLFVLEGATEIAFFSGSWNSSLSILNMALISAIMALGVNLQWGFAGLFNVGVMGFVALGGLAAVLIAMPPVPEAWAAGGPGVLLALALGALTIVAAILGQRYLPRGRVRGIGTVVILIGGFVLYRSVFDPATTAIEAVNPAATGYLGGLNPGGAENYRDWGWVTILAWPVGGLLAAGAAWVIGKTALGLRSDYLAIATLGIAEIIIAILKNEEWLTRGVKNVFGLPRPVPDAVDLQGDPVFVERAAALGLEPTEASTLYVQAGYALMFTAVLILCLVLAQLALRSPWGRMMRAIRDNETAAEAMGKDVTGRHLQIFILGSALCGIAGAMMTTLDGQLNPPTYQPLRFTFLIWVMVIVGGSGNNFGAVLGGFLIWFLWVQVEPMGQWIAGGLGTLAEAVAADWLLAFSEHVSDNVQQLRLLTMGVVLLAVLRFSPRGLIPEK